MNRRVEIILDTSEATGGGPDDPQQSYPDGFEPEPSGDDPADFEQPYPDGFEPEPTGGGPAGLQEPADEFFDSSDERPLTPLPPVDQVLPEDDDRVGEPASIDE